MELAVLLLIGDVFKNAMSFLTKYTHSHLQISYIISSLLFLFQRLARTGIIVTTSEAILLQLVADKEHPKFKEIQNLIKASAPESGLLSKV